MGKTRGWFEEPKDKPKPKPPAPRWPTAADVAKPKSDTPIYDEVKKSTKD
jgi:hypothetical protein